MNSKATYLRLRVIAAANLLEQATLRQGMWDYQINAVTEKPETLFFSHL